MEKREQKHHPKHYESNVVICLKKAQIIMVDCKTVLKIRSLIEMDHCQILLLYEKDEVINGPLY